MERIVDPFAAVDPVTGRRLFTEGDPVTGTNATNLRAVWLNNVQEEVCSAITGTGQALDPDNRGQLLAAIQTVAVALSSSVVGKNLILNGGMDVQQRVRTAGSFAVVDAPVYTLDRWRAQADDTGGAGTATVSRQAFTLGQTDVPGAAFFLRWVQGVAATLGPPVLEQRVEDVTRFQLGQFALGVALKGSGALSVTVRVLQRFGTGGSPSAEVEVGTAVLAVTTSWTRQSVLLDLDAFGLTGKTLGTAGDDHLSVSFELPEGATYTLDVADVQLERGLTASAFARRTLALELAQCRRYYERSGGPLPLDTAQSPPFSAVQGHSIVGDNLGTPGESLNAMPHALRLFKVIKRGVPRVTWWNPRTGTADGGVWGNAGSYATDRTVNAANGVAGTYKASVSGTGYPSFNSIPITSDATFYAVNWEADAEL